MTDRDLIKALGGMSKVAARLQQKPAAVGNWMLRGIPWRWRPIVAALAEESGVPLPADFLTEQKGDRPERAA